MGWFGRKKGSDASVVSAVPIVQGSAVQSSHNRRHSGGPQNDGVGDSGVFVDPVGSSGYYNGRRGDVQQNSFKDVFFAILFILHLIVMLYFMFKYTQNIEGGAWHSGIGWVVTVCAAIAVALSTASLVVMMCCSATMVKIALIFSVCMSAVMAVVGALSGELWMALLGGISFLMHCCYAYFVWSRIPFAAANLNTALTAVRQNLGLAAVAYLFLALSFCWSLWWMVSVGIAYQRIGWTLFLFLVSYYWVHQVLENVVHVTTVGVVGMWWYVPKQASSFCSSALFNSLGRSLSYSFGSICFGSLIVAIVQALRALWHIAHQNDDCSIIICLIDCILACIQGIVEYLNKWAYVYVGLYGYSYLDAGKNVMQLFQNKGWTAIITDDLADNVLMMVSMAIAVLTGLVGFVLGLANPNLFVNLGLPEGGVGGFICGALVGYLFASVFLGIVSSAVNTVIVLFAEAPREFEQNHPQLSREMREAWRRAWPGEYHG